MATTVIFGADPGGVAGLRSALFVPQLANVASASATYPALHLLSLPQEVRDRVFQNVEISADDGPEEPLTSHGFGGLESLPAVCRQLFHNTANDRHQFIVKVPHNRLQLFVDQALKNGAAYKNMKSLTLELPHNSPSQFFRDIATILHHSKDTLEQLKIFGVGPDGYGAQTSSLAHPCGKVDTSIRSGTLNLTLDGQEYQKRIKMINQLQFLGKIKVLVLDNLNMPVTQAQVLKNKPDLQRLRIGTDPRSVLHNRYMMPGQNLGLNNLIHPITQAPPQLRELDIASNSVVILVHVFKVVLPTLEILNWNISDFAAQHGNNFLQMGMNVLSRLAEAKKLRVLRLCIHSAMYDHVNDMATFMYMLRTSIQRVPSLKVIELHIHSKARWYAQEIISDLPKSVERVYLADHFIHKDIPQLTDLMGTLTNTWTQDYSNGWNLLGEDLSRKDFIPFSDKNLGFVSYEYDHQDGEQFRDNVANFMRVNARMLDKELNRHLAKYNGKHIPVKTAAKPHVTVFDPLVSDMLPRSRAEVEANRKELTRCGLYNNKPYFGNEDRAEKVFLAEPVATASERSHYSLPTIWDVENPFCAASHWIST
ncbi:hypothetical protein A1O3_01090 [Capronia epimyces CBS 606.96]|uniref:Uncharacterized protein n=1 Tax=Capronia epimyces CBS 606.96 TaxID=1182542 RepID=W9YJ29_9EURO|nr:uncharacterized protein A1O3_01090 [Capronia epimyces CBS 606.96]EXJ92538.1 hypothetical protein A1O3_01090 [Capronia epimyces CBS 606.96]